MATQSEQINILKHSTGLSFKFIPIEQSPYRIASYVATVPSDKLSMVNMDDLNNYILQDNGKTCDIILVDSNADYARLDALNQIVMRNNDSLDSIREYTTPIGQIHDNNVYIEPLPTHKDNIWSPIVNQRERAIAVVNINGARLPFYVSSGLAGKDKDGIPSGKWYPLQGVSDGWLNKMRDMMNNPYTELDTITEMLDNAYPATKMKMAAHDNKLPLRPQYLKPFLDITNADFPDGVNETNNATWIYRVNERKYLARIVRKWRSMSKNSFNNTQKLKNDVDLRADKIADKLYMDAFADDDKIFINTTSAFEDIKFDFARSGIVYDSDMYFQYPNTPGFGLDNHAIHFSQPRLHTAQQFTTGTKRVSEKQSLLSGVWKKIQSVIGA